jgi:RsiW-degrading membrane proteinase PrsW (M82 family)
MWASLPQENFTQPIGLLQEIKMNMQTANILIAIVALAIVALLVFVVKGKRQEKTLSPLAGLAFGFILAGILFTSERLISYGLMGIGVALAVVDMFVSKRGQVDNPPKS